MAVQAQPYGAGNTGFDLFSRSCWTGGDVFSDGNGVFDQLGFDPQQIPFQRTNEIVQTEVPRSLEYMQILNDHMEKQSQDLDCLIRSENERLRTALLEQRKQEVANLLRKLEFQASVLLRQKDEAMWKLSSKTMELLTTLKRLESETAMWQRMARDKEAMVVALNKKLQELKERHASVSCFDENAAEDEGSCCGDSGGQDAEENTVMVGCRSCTAREACVLFLPCRHLCCCRDCAAFLESCPVCRTSKKAIIETLIF